MAFDPEINMLAVLGATVAYFALGFVWFRALAGPWARHTGLPEDHQPDGKQMVRAVVNHLVGSFLTVLVFAHVLAAFGAAEVATSGGTVTAAAANAGMDALDLGLALEGAGWMWLGFFLPLQASRVAWEQKSWTLVAINGGYNLVGLLIAAAILVSWT